MAQRTVNMGSDEPEQRNFEKPSENMEHLFQVVDILDNDDPDIVVTKLEVAEGDELGRSILQRINLDSGWKGFFLTRLFLKAICEEYKGDGINIDSDNWIGRSFYATVIHNTAKNGKVYANIDEYNFEKLVDNSNVPVATAPTDKPKSDEATAWDDV